MGQSSDQLRQEIDQKRNDAADKIDRLQHQVQDTSAEMQDRVQTTATQVQDTVQQVRDQAQGMVDDTVQTVRENVENFDFERQVQQRPLLSVGLAFVGGIVLGRMGGGGDHGQHYQQSGRQSYDPGHGGSSVTEGLRGAVQRSGLDETISNTAAALMGTLTDQLKSTLNSSFPGFSKRMDTAQHTHGSFAEKAQASQDATGSGPAAASNAQ